MFLTLLAKEIRQHLLTFRFAAALTTIFILVTASVWILSDDYIRRRDSYNTAAERSVQQDRQVYVPAQISPTIHRPPSPLSIFAQGEDRKLGNSVTIKRWTIPREASGSFTDNDFMAALPDFDLMTIFSIVISLFGILFAYDGISGEREGGTLRLISTGSIGKGTLYAAKFISCTICLAIPFVLVMICSAFILTFLFQINFSWEQWSAIGVIALAGLIYGALFIAVGLLCSVLVRRSSTALVMAMLFWALGVLVTPAAAKSAAAMLIEPPESEEIVQLEREMLKVWREERSEYSRNNPGQFGGWCGFSSPENFYFFDTNETNFHFVAGYVRYIEPRMMERADRVWQVYREHEEQRKQQADLADTLSSVAPVHHLRKTFMLLSRTDISTYDRFMDSSRRYRSSMIDDFRQRGYYGKNAYRFFSRLNESDITVEQREKRQKRNRRIFEEVGERRYFDNFWDLVYGPLPESEIPRFSFSEEAPDFEAALAPITVLTISVVLIFILGFVAFIRYDVR